MKSMKLKDLHPNDQQNILVSIRVALSNADMSDLVGDDLADRISVQTGMDVDGLDPTQRMWDISLGGFYRILAWTDADATTPDVHGHLGLRRA